MILHKDNNHIIRSIFYVYENLPFNKVLGLNLEYLEPDEIRVIVAMRDELIGNYIHGILHGGVISSVLDVTGGLTATVDVLKHNEDLSEDQIQKRVARISTIDLRVDYLRPGRGKCFTATGKILRTGKKVAVTRMEMHNEHSLLIAVGTGTYSIG